MQKMLRGHFDFVIQYWPYMAKYYQERGVKIKSYQNIAKLNRDQLRAIPELLSQLTLLSVKYIPSTKARANLIYGEIFYNQSDNTMVDHSFCATPTGNGKVYLLQTSPWCVYAPKVSLIPETALEDFDTFGLANYSTVIDLYYYQAKVKERDYLAIIRKQLKNNLDVRNKVYG